jgi:integrase
MAKISLTDNAVSKLKPGAKPYEEHDATCKGLMLRVETSGTKSWWLYLYTEDNAPVRKRYRWKIGDASTFKLYRNTPSKPADRARSIRDVAEELKAKARLVDLRAERRAAIAKNDTDKVATLAGFIDLKYLDHYRAEGYARPDSQIKWVKGAFADMLDMKIASITHLTLRKWQTEASKTRAPATVARLLQSLSGILTHAIAEDVIDTHPLQAAQRKKSTTRFKLVTPQNKRVRFLSEDEETRLRKALIERDREMIAARMRNIQHKQDRGYEAPPAINGCYFDHLSPLVLIAINSGIRLGALLQLEWSDIENGMIHVRASLDKARKGYVVPLNKDSAEVVRLLRRQTGGRGLLFKHSVTGKRITSVKTAWGKLLERAKISDFRFHDLRHSFASKLVMRGTDLYTVSQLLGHSTTQMTQRYAHLAPDHLKAAVEALDA